MVCVSVRPPSPLWKEISTSKFRRYATLLGYIGHLRAYTNNDFVTIAAHATGLEKNNHCDSCEKFAFKYELRGYVGDYCSAVRPNDTSLDPLLWSTRIARVV